MISTYVTY